MNRERPPRQIIEPVTANISGTLLLEIALLPTDHRKAALDTAAWIGVALSRIARDNWKFQGVSQ